MRRGLLVAAVVCSLAGLNFVMAEPKHSVRPKAGLVPNAQTAIQIAVAVWVPIYGEKMIQGERPFSAELKDGVWTVEGSLPKGMRGGTALAEIAQEDGRIFRVSHGR
jgi:NTF2 fold immunity protein